MLFSSIRVRWFDLMMKLSSTGGGDILRGDWVIKKEEWLLHSRGLAVSRVSCYSKNLLLNFLLQLPMSPLPSHHEVPHGHQEALVDAGAMPWTSQAFDFEQNKVVFFIHFLFLRNFDKATRKHT